VGIIFKVDCDYHFSPIMISLIAGGCSLGTAD